MDKGLRKKIDGRERTITSLLRSLEKLVAKSQRDLADSVREHFIDRLDTDEEGVIKSTLANRRLLENFENIFNRFASTTGAEVAVEIAKGSNTLMQVNKDFYSMFAKKTQLNKISANVQDIMRSWLGITPSGHVKANGYLDTIIKAPTIKAQLQDISMRAVIGQQGWEQTKREVGEFIQGNREKTGVMERYYRNYVYDTYSKVDRAVSEQYAVDLKLNFAIYEGGLIETSRTFCKEHNGNVYHKSEIADFKPTKAIPPDYNPFLDLGGYGCRHHLNWIPDSVALALRPEAKKFILQV